MVYGEVLNTEIDALDRGNRVKFRFDPNRKYCKTVGRGCSECNAGAKGRIGLYEFLPITRSITDMVNKGTPLFEMYDKIFEESEWKDDDERFISLLEDGLMKVGNGDAYFDEVIEFYESLGVK